ncbi:MAG: cbb3-type cytochrome c oxidase N-terminal domain-containing protein [Cyclobacteriaceae bacterium]
MNKRIIILLFMQLIPALGMAQAETAVAYTTEEILLLGIVVLLSFIILASVGLVYSIFSLLKVLKGQKDAEATEAAEEVGFWTRINTKFNDAVPLEREEEVLTDHEYDGIHELDNNLPPWWKAMFYATIVFAVGYLAAVHLMGWIPTQEEAYRQEVADAELAIAAYNKTRENSIDEASVQLVMDDVSLTEGTQLYKANCMPCHAIDGGGGVGPNLTDKFWIHGGGIVDVFKTIKYGVPSKGMISWEDKMTPKQMQNVASYVLSLQGTTPANPKEPQGDLYEPKDEEVEKTDSAEVEVAMMK